MAAPIEFHFEFASPYGYVASAGIDDLAARHGRAVSWRPFLLGAVFKITGGKPATQMHPMRANYAIRDIVRSCAFHGLPYKRGTALINGLNAVRTFYWIDAKDPAKARAFAKAVYRAGCGEARDIGSPEAVAEIAGGLGIEQAAVIAALQDPAVKDLARKATDDAVAHGVFGSPFFIVDGEPFWGVDRMDQLERWLAKGPY